MPLHFHVMDFVVLLAIICLLHYSVTLHMRLPFQSILKCCLVLTIYPPIHASTPLFTYSISHLLIHLSVLPFSHHVSIHPSSHPACPSIHLSTHPPLHSTIQLCIHPLTIHQPTNPPICGSSIHPFHPTTLSFFYSIIHSPFIYPPIHPFALHPFIEHLQYASHIQLTLIFPITNHCTFYMIFILLCICNNDFGHISVYLPRLYIFNALYLQKLIKY